MSGLHKTVPSIKGWHCSNVLGTTGVKGLGVTRGGGLPQPGMSAVSGEDTAVKSPDGIDDCLKFLNKYKAIGKKKRL